MLGSGYDCPVFDQNQHYRVKVKPRVLHRESKTQILGLNADALNESGRKVKRLPDRDKYVLL